MAPWLEGLWFCLWGSLPFILGYFCDSLELHCCWDATITLKYEFDTIAGSDLDTIVGWNLISRFNFSLPTITQAISFGSHFGVIWRHFLRYTIVVIVWNSIVAGVFRLIFISIYLHTWAIFIVHRLGWVLGAFWVLHCWSKLETSLSDLSSDIDIFTSPLFVPRFDKLHFGKVKSIKYRCFLWLRQILNNQFLKLQVVFKHWVAIVGPWKGVFRL